MDDLISRKAAIDAMTNILWHYPNECYQNLNEYEFAKRLAELGLKSVPSAQHWILCSERMPECEEEVLICTAPSKYRKSLVVPAIYEDGTMLENESMWRWEDVEYAGWNEEEDCGIIPEGWWENRHFNLEEEYNHPIDVKVLAWMPLPKPYEVEK